MERIDMDKMLDLPGLVSSDEDDDNNLTLPVASNGDKARLWSKQRREEREEAENLIGLVSLGPLLFGFDNGVEKYWISALYDASILLKKNREKMIDTFNEKEEEVINKMEDIVKYLKSELCNEAMVKCALDMIDAVEKKVNQPSKGEKKIDIDIAIATALSYPLYEELEKKIKEKVGLKGKENFGIIYVLKNYHRHIVEFGNGSELENKLRMEWLERNKVSVDQHKDLGKKAYIDGKYFEAIQHYTDAIISDPINHISYSNRAATYINVQKFREAYCDSNRSLVIDPNWHKAYYRCAQALFHLDEFEKALEYNYKGKKMFPEVKDYQVQERDIREGMANSATRRLNEERIKFAMDNNIGQRKSKQTEFSIKKSPMSQFFSLPRTSSHMGKENTVSMDIPELVDSDEEDRLVKKKKKKKKEKEKKTEAEKNEDEYMALLREGSEAYLNNKYKTAVEKYNQATEFYDQPTTLINSVEEIDIVVRLYATGMALTERGVFNSITKALSKFKSICEEHSGVHFPPVYYGLTRCYLDLNRFSEALKPCDHGLKLVNSGVQCGRLLWPGTETVIPHSNNKILKTCLLELLEKIKFAPKPDVICRFHDPSLEDQRTVIYFSDFDFKGFVRIECYAKCFVEFHQHCWKNYKKSHDLHSDKQILNSRCLTPDCFSFVHCISVYHNSPLPENAIIKVADTPPPIEQNTKTIVRMKPSAFTVAKREAKKRLRKQRKLENKHNRVDDNATMSTDGAMALNDDHHEDIKVEQDLDDAVIIYKKDEDNNERQKSKKPSKSRKKEKKKNASVLNVEVNFTDRKEENLAGTFTDFDNLPSRNMAVTNRPPIDPTDDRVAKELFDRFAALLGVTGPLHIQDKILLEEVADFPPDGKAVIQKFGGLRQFLLNCLKFALIGDHVCLLKDSVIANEMSKNRYLKHKDLQESDSGTALPDSSSLASVVAKPQNAEMAIPLPTKLRSGLFESNEKADSASAATKHESETMIWQEMAEKRKKVKSHSTVSPIDEQTDSERIVKTDQIKVRSSGYNALDDISIQGFHCTMDNMDDIDVAPARRKMDDIDEFEDIDGPSTLVDKLKMGDNSQIHSRSSSISDLSEHSDISIDILYRSASPSSVSSRSSNPSSYRGSPASHVTPSSPITGLVKNNMQKPACPSPGGTKRDVTSKLFSDEKDLKSVICNPDIKHLKIGEGVIHDSFDSSDSQNVSLTNAAKKQNGRNVCSDEQKVKNQTDNLLKNEPIQSSAPRVEKDSSLLRFLTSVKKDRSASFKQSYSSIENMSSSEVSMKPLSNPFSNISPRVNSYPSKNPISTPTKMAIPPNPFMMAQTEKARTIQKDIETEKTIEKFKLDAGLQQKEACKLFPKMKSETSAYQNFSTLTSNTVRGFQKPPHDISHQQLLFPLNCNNSAPIHEHQSTLPMSHTKRKTCDAQVQAVAMTTESGINTELDMDKLLSEYLTNFETVAQLHQEKQHMEDKFGKKISILKEELNVLKSNKQRIERNLEEKVDLLLGLTKSLSEQEKALKQVEEEKSALQDHFTTKCLDLETAKITLNELTNELNLVTENKELLLARAKTAEIHSLNVQEEAAEKSHAKTKNQAQFHIDHLSKLVALRSTEVEYQQSVLRALNHWKKIKEQTDDNLSSLKVEFERQKKLIADGKMLSELPPISRSPPLDVMPNMLLPPPPGTPNMPKENIGGFTSGAISKVPQTQAPLNTTSISRPPPGFRNPAVTRAPRQFMPSVGATPIASAVPGRIGSVFRQAGRTEGRSATQQSSTDKLMQRLQFRLPFYKKQDFLKVLSELRTARGGKLSGLTLDAIETFVTERLQRRSDMNTSSPVSERDVSAPDLEMFSEDEDPCAICHDEMSAYPVKVLDCKHSFHEKCIHQWLKEQKTCPNCRVHIVLHEEFPALC